MAQAGARTPLPSCHRLCRWLPSVPRVHSTCRRIDGGMAWHGMVLPHPSESITSRRHVTRNLAPSLRHAIVPSTMVDLRLATMVNDVNLFINYTWIMFEKSLMILVYAYTQQFDCNIRYQVVHVENNPYPFKSFQVACCKTHLFILTDLSGRAVWVKPIGSFFTLESFNCMATVYPSCLDSRKPCCIKASNLPILDWQPMTASLKSCADWNLINLMIRPNGVADFQKAAGRSYAKPFSNPSHFV